MKAEYETRKDVLPWESGETAKEELKKRQAGKTDCRKKLTEQRKYFRKRLRTRNSGKESWKANFKMRKSRKCNVWKMKNHIERHWKNTV